MLELKGIKKSYKVGDTKQEVLKGIDIKFRENEFTSILGASGSGKTTLLNIIGGLDKYTEGDLIIDGISTKNYQNSDWDSYRNYRVGFIFQSYNLIMHQSVYSNVEIALTLSGVSKAKRKEKIISTLKKVGLGDHIHKKPTQLSGGQMQRVAIARALVNDPDIILADEPTGALDSVTSIQIMDLLKEIAKDKLIIMVTHNPSLAEEYSNRIIELKDGVIVKDSNPFDGEEKEKEERKHKKTSMSLFTCLLLSFNNLLTKKGRTILTALAGSIGIIGIALILALSNGVSTYVSNMEREASGDYPIEIEKNSMDIMSSLSAALESINVEQKYDDNQLHSRDDIISSLNASANGLIKRNDTKEFKKYIESNDEFKKYASSITYSYDINLQVYTKDYDKVVSSDITTGEESSVFAELDQREEAKDSKYTILAGKMPENYNEIVLLVGEDNKIQDSLLYALKIKDPKNLKDDINKFMKDSKYKVESSTYKYEDFLNRDYKIILNTDYYKEENGKFIDYSNDSNFLKEKIDKGIDLKIVGVIKEKNNSSNCIGYTHDLTMHLIKEIAKTNMYKEQISNKNINVLTGLEFDSMFNTYEKNAKELGIYEEDDPSKITIYPNNYDAKESIQKLIDKYNKEKEDNGQSDLKISYSDLMKTLTNGITKVVKIVSIVLIGFVAISLVVSSIMISIITYISVLERTKEIGILRAIGASKKDVKRVFIAETIIEGLIAGGLGIGITILLSMPINRIAKTLGQIDGVAKLPIKSAIFLILLSVILNVIAGIIPAGMAAKKDPVESLRNE